MTILAALPGSAAAQPVGHGAINLLSGFIRGVDITYNPSTGGYFVVGGQGHILGMCLNADGSPASGWITINNTGFGAFPRAKWSPHAGAFLVVWGEEVGNPSELRARMVNCGGGMSPEHTISGGTNAWLESGAAIVYSEASQKFLVAWKSLSPPVMRVVLVDNNAAQGSPVVTVTTGFARDPGAAWNPHTNEFGVSYSGEAGGGAVSLSGFVVVPAGNPGAFRRQEWNHFGGGLFTITDLDYVAATGGYLMGWYRAEQRGVRQDGALRRGGQSHVRASRFDPTGVV